MIHVRPAQSADAEVISELSAEVQAHHARALPHLFKPGESNAFPPAAVRELLQDPGRLFLVAFADTLIVGYASAQIERRAETPIRCAQSALIIQWIGVKTEWRRRGVGRALMSDLRNSAERCGLGVMLLDVWSFNEDARAFYEAIGFRPQRQILSLDLSEA